MVYRPYRSTKEIFSEKSKKIHNNKYSYDKVVYKNNKFKVEIICNICNTIFWQTPNDHLSGKGCIKCFTKKLNEKAKIFKDEITGFYVNNVIFNSYKRSANKRNLCFEITPQDIFDVYKRQNGLCAFTNAKLICDTDNYYSINWSIDRIDNDKGYIKDNIVLVSKTANMIRNRSTIKELLEFCNMVVSAHNGLDKYIDMSPEERASRLDKYSIKFCKKNN